MDTELELRVKNFAAENYMEGLNCAESVLDALIRAGAIDMPPEAVALCTGFGSGIGLTGNTCGALSAAIMALGSKFGRRAPMTTEADARKKELAGKNYRVFNNMAHEFVEKNGSALCREISAGMGEWKGVKRKERCHAITCGAAVMVLRYLQMTPDEAFSLQYGRNLGGCR